MQFNVKLFVAAVNAPVEAEPEVGFVPLHAPLAVHAVVLFDDHVSEASPPLATVTGFAAMEIVGGADPAGGPVGSVEAPLPEQPQIAAAHSATAVLQQGDSAMTAARMCIHRTAPGICRLTYLRYERAGTSVQLPNAASRRVIGRSRVWDVPIRPTADYVLGRTCRRCRWAWD